jgi:hypothetical protein
MLRVDARTTVHNAHIPHVLYGTVQTTMQIQDDIISGTAQLVAPTTGAHWPLQINTGHDATPSRHLQVPSLLCVTVRCVELIFKLMYGLAIGYTSCPSKPRMIEHVPMDHTPLSKYNLL